MRSSVVPLRGTTPVCVRSSDRGVAGELEQAIPGTPRQAICEADFDLPDHAGHCAALAQTRPWQPEKMSGPSAVDHGESCSQLSDRRSAPGLVLSSLGRMLDHRALRTVGRVRLPSRGGGPLRATMLRLCDCCLYFISALACQLHAIDPLTRILLHSSSSTHPTY